MWSEGSVCYNLDWFTDPIRQDARNVSCSAQFQMAHNSELQLQIERKTIKEVFRQVLDSR